MPQLLNRLALALLLCLVLPAAGFSAAGGDPLVLIERDFQAGVLSLDQKVLLQITAIDDYASLPDRYQTAGLTASVSPIRCITPTLLEIRRAWDQLSLSTQEAFLAAFARVETEFTHISPSGFFLLHFDTGGIDSVPEADIDLSGVPDFVEKCALYLDTSLTYHIDQGFLLPPSDGILGGDSLFDVYFKEMVYYGYAMPEGPGPEDWNDAYSYLTLNSDFLGFASNSDPEGNQAGAAKATCAHEFHHCVQYAYDTSEDLWIMELDAVGTEDFVFDLVDDNYNYLPLFMDFPEKSLFENTDHAYGCFLWGVFLAEHFDTSLTVAMWEGARYQTFFNALSDTLMGRYGWTADSAFSEFTVWNYLTTGRDDDLHYGETYPEWVNIGRAHNTYPVTLLTSPTNPAGYGSCYLEFYPSAEIGRLEIVFNGSDSRQWAAFLVKSTSENVHEFEKLDISGPSYYTVISVPEFETYYRVALVVANVAEFEGGAYFSYSASIIPPYSVASSVITVDSAVYSGGLRNFEYAISNTSPLIDVLRVTAWDSAGWVDPDTFDVSLGAGEDSVVFIAVTPPGGTPLGSQTDIWGKVWSLGNTAAVDSQTVGALTMLQRGDVNFDGTVVVSDLTYLVSYLFGGGAAPKPVSISGDHSCDDLINVSDLTLLVKYLFQGGGTPPCNPY